MVGKAVHFGGGNIGRGFIAQLFNETGYEIVFVDVLDSIIEALQKVDSYTVTEVDESGEKSKTISNYRAINSKYQEQDVIKEISEADIVTCAVGPNILKFIAPAIAKAIKLRTMSKPWPSLHVRMPSTLPILWQASSRTPKIWMKRP